jgi:hypothetical protein
VDNVFDWYHVPISHASSNLSGHNAKSMKANSILSEPGAQRVTMGEFGHVIGGPRMTPRTWEAFDKLRTENVKLEPMMREEWRDRPEVKEALGEVGRDIRGHPNIFPNMWIASGFTQVCLRLPKGPTQTELWWFQMTPKEFDIEQRAAWTHRGNHTFGPAGFLEQDDGENWDQSTRAMQGPIARKYPLNFEMSFRHGEVKMSKEGLGYIDANVNEHAQLWVYRAWAEWMDAPNWDALRADHSLPPKAGEMV